MTAAKRYRLTCPKCRTITPVTFSDVDKREAAIARREVELRQREQLLRVRETEHQQDIRLIRGCLHPDRHPDQSQRYTKAWQAFDRLLESGREPAPAVDAFDDDIPF